MSMTSYQGDEMQMLHRDPWPFLPLQLRLTCSVVNDGKEIHLNLPDDFVGQKLTVSRSETVGMWNLHIGTEGFELIAGKDKTCFCRIPAGAFPELKLRSFATAYYDGERRGSRILCGKMFDHLAYKTHEIKRDELTNAERTRRLEAAQQGKRTQHTLRLASFKDLPTAIEQKKEEKAEPMIALYPITISTGEKKDAIYFRLPDQFKGHRFVIKGEAGNRWLEKSDEGVKVIEPRNNVGVVYAQFAARKNGLVLLANQKHRFTCQWTGEKLMLGDAVEKFIAPAVQPQLQMTSVPVTREPSIIAERHVNQSNLALTSEPQPVLRRDLDEDQMEIIELKEALATVNRIAKKRDMEVVIKDDGSIGLKMVVVSEF